MPVAHQLHNQPFTATLTHLAEPCPAPVILLLFLMRYVELCRVFLIKQLMSSSNTHEPGIT